MTSILASSQAFAGHPIWHFTVVAGAGVLTFLGIKASEWRQTRGMQIGGLDGRVALLSVLGFACCAIHAYVCPEHFHEWVVYGVFFMCASALQAAWAIVVLARPSRRLLLFGAVGNAAVVMTYFISRFVGIPFGPDAFKPETYDALSMVATSLEAGLVALSVYLISTTRFPSTTRAASAA
jgi:hypothetical protein